MSKQPNDNTVCYLYIYDGSTVLQTVTCLSEDIQEYVTDKDTYLFSDRYLSPDECYVEDGEIVEKKTMPIRARGNTLTRLPKPCTVHSPGGVYEVDDGEFEFDADYAGTYQFTVTADKYKTWRGELTVESNL